MINRNTLECESCHTRIITRTAIGHGDRQVHSFPCPTCKVGITYTLNLDQKAVTFDYDENIENGLWVDSEDGATAEVTFDSELLVPRDALTTPFLSPFIAVSGRFRDRREFQRHEAVRLHWRTNIWPATRRMAVHYKNQNWNLFDSEAKKIGKTPDKKTREARLALLRNALDLPLPWFTFDHSQARNRIRQRMALARSISEVLATQVVQDYVQTGRGAQMWDQIHDIHDEFIRGFPSLSPILQINYWTERPKDLDNYAVCDKRFGELKHLYISCFETFCRLSVIAIAYEAIIHHGELCIPTKKSKLSLWDYEQLANAKKADHLNKYPILDLFSPYMDTALRNGIGHNAAHYDPATDEVVCARETGPMLKTWRIGYTSFSEKTMDIFSILFYLEPYYFDLLAVNSGKI